MRLPAPVRHAALLVWAVAILGCSRVSDADRNAAIETVRANLAAMQAVDLDAALATTHPKSPNYEKAREQIEAIFKHFKLSYELESAKVESGTDTEIRVRFVQVTRKLEGPEEFPDNRVDGIHLLKRDGSTWKIWSTQMLSVRTLDGQPITAR